MKMRKGNYRLDLNKYNNDILLFQNYPNIRVGRNKKNKI